MSAHESKSRPSALIVGAIGVVFGDIGTSPLYALKETFAGHHPIAVEPASILGVLSLIFWTIMALVTLKYVAIIMRADNRGEGGSLALLARVTELTKNSHATWFVTMLGIFAAALFYGDSMITPAISVLSAVEGLNVVAPGLKEYILPITAIVLTGLFWIQKHGTGVVGRFFGPVMCAWFGVLGVLGAISILGSAGRAGRAQPVICIRVSDPRSLAQLPRARGDCPGGDRWRGAVHRHGSFRQIPDPRRLVRLRTAGAGPELLWPGRPAAQGSRLRSRIPSTCWRPAGH